MKRFVPAPLRPPLRRCLQFLFPRLLYESRLQSELEAYTAIQHVHDLPAIAHYWSNKHLAPMLASFGFTDAIQLFRTHMERTCRQWLGKTLSFLSVGAGDCACEVGIAAWLRENGIVNYVFECLDVNPGLLKRAEISAKEEGLSDHFTFARFDVNAWRPQRRYAVILAIQSLHHFVELETLFQKIHEALDSDGYFLTDDMIGRNGHQRWPEALKFVDELWSELPDKYKYNRIKNRLEKEYDNWDCSKEGFEGIRSQDILPLLVRNFHFELFLAFGNIVNVFIDRCFGPNFDPDDEWDRAFIDRVHALDVEQIENGWIKPTHMMAVMTRKAVERTIVHKHLTPEFCIRWP